MIEENIKSKLSQSKIYTITIVVIAVIFVLFISSGGKKKNSNSLKRAFEDTKNQIRLQDPNHGIKSEDRWMEQAEHKLDDYDKFQKGYLSDKNNFETRLDSIEKNYEEKVDSQSEVIESQGREIENLKKQIEAKQQPAVNAKVDPYSQNASGVVQQMVPTKGIQTITLNLEKAPVSQGDFHKSSEYVPAGAYASATIISGVDASVGISSQSDPRPILLRITGPAHSSIYEGNVQKADLTGCIVTGAASGDLSSEKIYVKLVNMSCSKTDDLVYETAVKGYVAGQGKAGVRGEVIGREGDFLSKSFLAGLVGGFGQGLSARVAPPLSFSTGVTLQNGYSNEDVAKKGAGQGISSATNRLADYYINRAEQYQPVVSIPSGIDVDVVFIEGFELNGKRHRTPAPVNNSQFINRNFNP